MFYVVLLSLVFFGLQRSLVHDAVENTADKG